MTVLKKVAFDRNLLLGRRVVGDGTKAIFCFLSGCVDFLLPDLSRMAMGFAVGI